MLLNEIIMILILLENKFQRPNLSQFEFMNIN